MATETDNGDFVQVDYSDTAIKAAEASASAASDTSLYMDQAAGWILLVPQKIKHVLTVGKAMDRQDVAIWGLSIALFVFLLVLAVRFKQVVSAVRSEFMRPHTVVLSIIYAIM